MRDVDLYIFPLNILQGKDITEVCWADLGIPRMKPKAPKAAAYSEIGGEPR